MSSWINTPIKVTFYGKSGSILSAPRIILKHATKPIHSAILTTNGVRSNKAKRSQGLSSIRQSQILLYPKNNKDQSLSIMTRLLKRIWTTGLLSLWTETLQACLTHKKNFIFPSSFKMTSNIVTVTGPMFWKDKKIFTFHRIITNVKNSTRRKVNCKCLNFCSTIKIYKLKTCLVFRSEYDKTRITNQWLKGEMQFF